MARQRVWFIIFAILWFVVCPVIASSFTENSNISKKMTISSLGPVVSGTTRTSTVISIVADNSCNPVIRYANDSYFSVSQNYDRELSSPQYGRNHAIRIPDLEPATTYHYNVRECGVKEIDRTFSTYAESGSCSFIVYGDTREQAPIYNQTERHTLVADRIAQEQDILFVVNSGDLVADSTDAVEWSRFFYATEKLRSMTTYLAVPGNHDTDRVLFRQLFGNDETNFFDCGNTRIALLDSTDMSSMSLQDQAGWLISVFGTHDGGKVAILHYPAYSSDEKHYGGWENIQRELVPAFQESGVQLVFNSHVHAFEQVESDGITYITEGRGGAPAYPLNSIRIPGSVNSYENTLGYSRVTVDPKAGIIGIDVIRVADVSGDLRSVTKIYPDETIDTIIRIPLRSSLIHLPDIAGQMCLHKKMNDDGGCSKSNLNRITPFLH
jgi:hypothetical protein